MPSLDSLSSHLVMPLAGKVIFNIRVCQVPKTKVKAEWKPQNFHNSLFFDCTIIFIINLKIAKISKFVWKDTLQKSDEGLGKYLRGKSEKEEDIKFRWTQLLNNMNVQYLLRSGFCSLFLFQLEIMLLTSEHRCDLKHTVELVKWFVFTEKFLVSWWGVSWVSDMFSYSYLTYN